MASTSASLIPLIISLSFALFLCISRADAETNADPLGAISQSISVVQEAIYVVRSSAASQQVISTCVAVLNNSIDNLKGAAAAFNASKRDEAKTKASAALTDVTKCNDKFGSSKPPPVKSALENASYAIKSALGRLTV